MDRYTRYTDEEICAMKNVPLGVAAAYLGIPAELLALGMRSRMLPVGLAVRSGGLAERRWRYRVIPRRLVACRRRMCGAPPVETRTAQLERLQQALRLLLEEQE